MWYVIQQHTVGAQLLSHVRLFVAPWTAARQVSLSFTISRHLLKLMSIDWRRKWHPTPVLLPGKSYGRRSLGGYSPWGRERSDMTEWLHFHFSLSCIGEGNGNTLQCSCLENPRDRGAWWAAVYGVAQGQTWLKWLSSSSIAVDSVMPSHYFVLCHPLLLLPSIFPSINVLSTESAFLIRRPKYWNFSFSISPSNEYLGLIFFRIDWFDLFAIQGTLKSLLQHHSLKASLL